MTETTEAKLSPQVKKALIALLVGGIAAILDSTMVTLAIHTLVVKLHTTTGTIQWVTTGFLLAVAVAIPVTGWAERRWGGKRVWMAALVLFVLASVLCAAAWNGASLIGFRVLQGFGAGLIFPLMQTLAVRAAGGQVDSRLMATVSLPIALGPILGPVIGGVILDWLSWRWLFLINVPVIAAGLLLAWRFLPADRPGATSGRGRLDWTGLALLAPALAGILLGLSQLSREGGIGHAGVLAPLVAGVVLLAAFVAWAARPGEREPIVDVRLLRVRSLGSASAVLFTAGAAMYAGMFLLPLYYQQLRGDSVLDAGLLLIPQGVGALASRFVVGGLADRFGARAVTIGGFLLTAVATVPFALAGPDTSLWWLGAVLLVRGLGTGVVLIPPMSVAYQDIRPTDIPHATMNTRIAQQVGASFGTAVVAVALQSLLGDGAAAAFHGAFWWAIGIAVVAVVPAVVLPARTRASRAATPVHGDEATSPRTAAPEEVA
ncbi:multidrug efflux MFS transporter [Microbispora hainanensis]|jgi:EmrB/QacA subfamily drug resistance transporter|uniref:Multidrug efflux MFS transporter n=1 Tax=Microbispora hainanensis TaxID=568844 RepID=A0ABZ1SFE7_9ACTN|nr:MULTISPECIES: MDR family MFS transporter [Microbispora]NJP26832.1 multidrug efflux MFS transporter [Microbispora sp. CL1-1]TQS11759.1 multidrug efflux MFS transporter [Microbispora sp. SCL1-1]